jgi:hypothetical protein
VGFRLQTNRLDLKPNTPKDTPHVCIGWVEPGARCLYALDWDSLVNESKHNGHKLLQGVAVSTLPGFMNLKIAFKVEIRVDGSLRI